MWKKMRKHWNKQMFGDSPLSVVTSSVSSHGNSTIFEGLTKSRLSELEKSSCWCLRLEVKPGSISAPVWDRQIFQTPKSMAVGWAAAPWPGGTPAPFHGICGGGLWKTLHALETTPFGLSTWVMSPGIVFSASLCSALPFSEQRRDDTGFDRSVLARSLWSEYLIASDHFSCVSSWGACEDLEEARSPTWWVQRKTQT